MKIVLAGGSGQLGDLLARHFTERGDQVVVFSRRPLDRPWKSATWDASTLGPWRHDVDGSDVVINLAGRSVNCRYTKENREEIMRSRVDSTRVLGEAISQAEHPPHTWLQASTATLYAHSFTPNDEQHGRIGGGEPGAQASWDFSVEVATTWEKTLAQADTPHTRKVALRSTIIMSPDRDGIFDVMMGLVKKGLGGKNGSGKQYVSWMHDVDFVRAIDFLIDHHELSGPVNLAAPHPLPNADFMRLLREAADVGIGLPATRWMLEIGALFMNTETELLLKSRYVVPQKLLDAGFSFEFPTWEAASRDLASRWNQPRRTTRMK